LPRTRLTLYLLLFALIAINYGDRVALSIGAHPIAEAFGISPIGMGYLLSCFSWTYVLCLIPWGMATDRVGIRPVSQIGIVIWSAATMLTGFAGGVMSMAAARLVMGGAEASAFPAAGRAVREWVPQESYGFANMLVVSGGYAGPAIGAVLFGWLAESFGWRAAFVVLGVFGFLWALAAMVWFRRPEDASPERPAAVKGERAGAFRELAASPSMWGLFLTQGACVYSHYLFLTWLPSYLQVTRHLSILKTGMLSAVPFALTVVCSLIVARASDRLLHDNTRQSGARRWMVAAMLLVSSAVLLTPLVGATWLVLLLVTVSLTGTSAATGLNSALLADLLASPENAGTATGILVVGGNVFGLLAPIVTGYVIALTGRFDAAWVIAGGLLLAGAVITVTMTRRMIGEAEAGSRHAAPILPQELPRPELTGQELTEKGRPA
jgi:MFS family permease